MNTVVNCIMQINIINIDMYQPINDTIIKKGLWCDSQNFYVLKIKIRSKNNQTLHCLLIKTKRFLKNVIKISQTNTESLVFTPLNSIKNEDNSITQLI